MLALFRVLDEHAEIKERRQQVAIINETGYLERDVDNLKAIFNEYADADPSGATKGLSLNVASFREVLLCGFGASGRWRGYVAEELRRRVGRCREV